MREGEGAVTGEAGVDTNTRPRVKQPASGRLPCHAGSSARSPGMAWGWDGVVGGRLQTEGMCVHTADSHRQTAGTNTTLPSSYIPITKKKIAAEILKKKKVPLIYCHFSCSLSSHGRLWGAGGQWEGPGRKSSL